MYEEMQVAINAKDKTAEALQSKNLELVNYNSFPAKDEILHTKQRYLRDKKEVKHSEIDFFLYLKGTDSLLVCQSHLGLN